MSFYFEGFAEMKLFVWHKAETAKLSEDPLKSDCLKI